MKFCEEKSLKKGCYYKVEEERIICKEKKCKKERKICKEKKSKKIMKEDSESESEDEEKCKIKTTKS